MLVTKLLQLLNIDARALIRALNYTERLAIIKVFQEALNKY